MENPLGLDQGENRKAIAANDGLQISCDECGMVGGVDQVSYKKSDDLGTIEFFILEMDECGHGFVIAVIDDSVRKFQERSQSLGRTLRQLQGSGDVTGYQRTIKKIQAAQIATKDAMLRLWKNRASKLSDWPPTPSLSNDS